MVGLVQHAKNEQALVLLASIAPPLHVKNAQEIKAEDFKKKLVKYAFMVLNNP